MRNSSPSEPPIESFILSTRRHLLSMALIDVWVRFTDVYCQFPNFFQTGLSQWWSMIWCHHGTWLLWLLNWLICSAGIQSPLCDTGKKSRHRVPLDWVSTFTPSKWPRAISFLEKNLDVFLQPNWHPGNGLLQFSPWLSFGKSRLPPSSRRPFICLVPSSFHRKA